MPTTAVSFVLLLRILVHSRIVGSRPSLCGFNAFNFFHSDTDFNGYCTMPGSVTSSPSSTSPPNASASTVMQKGMPRFSIPVSLRIASERIAIFSASLWTSGQRQPVFTITSRQAIVIIPPGQMTGRLSTTSPRNAFSSLSFSVINNSKPIHFCQRRIYNDSSIGAQY